MTIGSDEQACMPAVAYILHILLTTKDTFQHRVETMNIWSQPVWPGLRRSVHTMLYRTKFRVEPTA